MNTIGCEPDGQVFLTQNIFLSSWVLGVDHTTRSSSTVTALTAKSRPSSSGPEFHHNQPTPLIAPRVSQQSSYTQTVSTVAHCLKDFSSATTTQLLSFCTLFSPHHRQCRRPSRRVHQDDRLCLPTPTLHARRRDRSPRSRMGVTDPC